MESGGARAGGEEARLEVRCVVAEEEDGAEGEVGVQCAGEAAGQNERRFLTRECGTDRFFRVASAHSGEQDLDVEAGGNCIFEGSGFFFDGEANEGKR